MSIRQRYGWAVLVLNVVAAMVMTVVIVVIGSWAQTWPKYPRKGRREDG